jgi:hypothetical protein
MEQTNPRRRRASTRPAFADHINRLVIGNCAPSAPKRTEILADADPAFDGPVIPFPGCYRDTAPVDVGSSPPEDWIWCKV